MIRWRYVKYLFCIGLLGYGSRVMAQDYIPGQIYLDSTNYVAYHAGNLPIILSAPHGGNLEPSSIPDRDCNGCVTINDAYTKSITENIKEEIYELTGCYPHVIVNLLHRKKFDANRDIGDAADGNSVVEAAWYAYHDFIQTAKSRVSSDYGRGYFLDIHGHAHTIQRIELGYLLSKSELQQNDDELNTLMMVEESSIRTLANDNQLGLTHAALLRGEESFGSLMDIKGFPSVPSSADSFPLEGEAYFSGGYNTQRHGSRDDAGDIDAIQIELNQDIRFDAAIRAMLIDSIALTALEFYNYHYNDQFMGNYCELILNVDDDLSLREGISIYPNPSSSVIFMDLSVNEIETIELITVSGERFRLVFTDGYLNLSDFNQGIYMLDIRTKRGERSQKKIVKVD